MELFISVHMIVKERTNLGYKFLEAAFTSLYEATYPHEIILIDNGSSDKVLNTLYPKWIEKFKKVGITLKAYCNSSDDFGELRNQCIALTSPLAHIVHWIDSDEVYFPEDLDNFKNYLLPNNFTARQFYSY